MIIISILICFKTKYNEPKFLLILTILLIATTPVAYDYKLIMLYLPLYAFLRPVDDLNLKESKIVFILIGTILIPKTYYFLDEHLATSISTFLNPLLLITLLFFALTRRSAH